MPFNSSGLLTDLKAAFNDVRTDKTADEGATQVRDAIVDNYTDGGGGGGAVDSVNGQTGDVVLDYTDVGADADGAAAAAQAAAESYADTAIAAHVADTDPHGDRAYADTAIAAHVGASDPHGDRAYADTAAAGAQAAAETYADGILAAHIAATDPHGDRAYADTRDAATLTTAESYTDAAVAAEAATRAAADTALAAPTYFVRTATPTLANELVVTDTTEIAWDYGTAGQAKAGLVATTVVAGAYGGAEKTLTATVDSKGRLTALAHVDIAIGWAQITSGRPTTLAGYGITDAQPLDATLTAWAGAGAQGLAYFSAVDTVATLTLAADTGIYATGAGALATYALTSTGRSLGNLSSLGDLAISGAAVQVTQARGLRETSGPTTLTMGAVSDGQYLQRSGSTIIGVSLAIVGAIRIAATDTPLTGQYVDNAGGRSDSFIDATVP